MTGTRPIHTRAGRLVLAVLLLTAAGLVLSGVATAELTEGTTSDADTGETDIRVSATAEFTSTGALRAADALEHPSERHGQGDRVADSVRPGLDEENDHSANSQNSTDSGPDLNLVGIEATEEVPTDEDLEVSYTLENVGDDAGTESAVRLLINSIPVDENENVTVGPGETTNGTLVYGTVKESFEDGDTFSYTVQLSDVGDSSGGTVTVIGPDLDLESIDAPGEVEKSETLEVDYTLENTGNETGTEREVRLLIDGDITEVDANVTVQAGETEDRTLVFDNVSQEYQEGDSISYTVGLTENGERRSGSVDVVTQDGPPAGLDIQVDSVEGPEEISTEDILPVNYAIENVGNQSGTATVHLVVRGETVDSSENVPIDAGETKTGALAFGNVDEQYDPGQTIDYTIELPGFDDSMSGSTDIAGGDGADNDTGDDKETGGGVLEIASIESPDIVDPEDDLIVNYTIVNVGDSAVTESFVDLRVDGAPVDTDEDVTVQPGESVSGSLSYTSAAYNENETIEHSVELIDFEDSMEGETFAGNIERAGSVSFQGTVSTDSSSVSVVIESIEDLDGTGWIVVENLGTGGQSGVRPVGEGDFATVSLERIGGVQFGDTIEVRLAADNEFTNVLDTAATTVEAGNNDPIAAFGWNPGVPDTGQPVAFSAQNTRGGGAEIVEYRWDFDNDGEFDLVSERPVAQHTFESGGQREVRLVVENEVGLTDETVESVTVRETLAAAEPALSSLTIDGQGSRATIEAGDASVSVTVTNAGEEADRFTLQLNIGNSVTETTSTAELDGQESSRVTFEGVTGVLDPGTYDVTVSAASRVSTGEVTVEAAMEPEPEPAFTVSILETNSPITAGESLTVTAEIENIGEGNGTATVELDGGEIGGDTTAVSLDSGESATETFTVTAETENASEFVVTASVGGEESTATVTVEESNDGSVVTPILVFVLLLVLLLIGGVFFYYIYEDGQSTAAMEEL